jgi:hypothetical protein
MPQVIDVVETWWRSFCEMNDGAQEHAAINPWKRD